jgi:hypothetical protein
MKRLFACLLVAIFTVSTLAFAQDMSQDAKTKTDTSAKAPLKTLEGTIKVEGDKATFVSDKDQKSWDVMNPETVKDHDGHHVKVKAHVYADKNSIHVMNVSMAKEKSKEKTSSMK